MTHTNDDDRDLSFQLCVPCNHRCSEALHPDCPHVHRLADCGHFLPVEDVPPAWSAPQI
jgi:hypothetical protein